VQLIACRVCLCPPVLRCVHLPCGLRAPPARPSLGRCRPAALGGAACRGPSTSTLPGSGVWRRRYHCQRVPGVDDQGAKPPSARRGADSERIVASGAGATTASVCLASGLEPAHKGCLRVCAHSFAALPPCHGVAWCRSRHATGQRPTGQDNSEANSEATWLRSCLVLRAMGFWGFI